MRNTNECMELKNRSVSLASSGVIGYYIYNKLNETNIAEECPEEIIELPALKEATLREDGVVSVESVKRMSEIIAEQAKLYAEAIRNGIRTPIVVEDEYVEETYEEPAYEEVPEVEETLEETYEESEAPVEEAPVEEAYEEEQYTEDTGLPVYEDEAPSYEEPEYIEDTYADAPEAEYAEEEYVEPAFEENVAEEVAPVEEPVSPFSMPAQDPTAPVSFADMGGFGAGWNVPSMPAVNAATPIAVNVTPDVAPVAVPVAGVGVPVMPVAAEGGMGYAPVAAPVAVAAEGDSPFAAMNTGLPTMPAAPVEEAPQEEPVNLMETVEPLHKIEEEEEDEASKQEFNSIAAYLSSLG